VALGGHESLYGASGYYSRSQFSLPASPKLSASWAKLHAEGLSVDIITQISSRVAENEPLVLLENQWQGTILGASNLLPGLILDVHAGLQQISSVVGHYSSSSNESTSTQLKHLEPDLLIPEVYILEAYLQGLLCGRIAAGERITQEDINAITSLHPPASATELSQQDFLTKIGKAFDAGIRRRLMVTKSGYIAAVPEQTQVGDLICILFGCSAQVVLRKATDQESFALVGES
jgi:hypothetical protein